MKNICKELSNQFPAISVDNDRPNILNGTNTSTKGCVRYLGMAMRKVDVYDARKSDWNTILAFAIHKKKKKINL